MTRSSKFLLQLHVTLLKAILWVFLNYRGVMIYFASWWSIRGINMTVEISMLGRDAHMKVLNVKHVIVISHVILYVHRLPLYLRECKCETMNPGPILNIRKHSSYFAAIYFTCTLLYLHLQFEFTLSPSPLASQKYKNNPLHIYFLICI